MKKWTESGSASKLKHSMKVFVSGQIDEKERIREVYQLLEEAGCVITHDWTVGDPLVVKESERDEAGKRAYRDISGVADADVYILMSDNEKVGKGMYVELGAALALQQTGNAPKVYVVGPRRHLSIFYLHPDVEHRDRIEDVIEEIGASRA